VRGLLLIAALLALPVAVAADDPICFTWVNAEPPYDRTFLADLDAQEQAQVTQDEAARVLFGSLPASVRAYNGVGVVADEGPPPPSGTRCDQAGYSRLLYSGQFFIRRATGATGHQAFAVDPNCWYRAPAAAGYDFLPIGKCAVCY
jgi:hypothetical protein